jgi:catechol-2,3-dioxygenase
MGSRWRGVVVAASDPARLSRWWAEVLGYRILDEHSNEVAVGPAEGQPLLSFLRGPTDGGSEPNGSTKVHLDLRVDDPDAEVERLVNMGARTVPGGTADRLVLADPEGNEFRLLAA